MTPRIEWRTRAKGDDALIFVREFGEGGEAVLKAWPANQNRIGDFLNNMLGFNTTIAGPETDVNMRHPQAWGRLVIARAVPDGDVLDIDPEPYWDEIYYWFRSRGVDPHPWSHVEPAAAQSG